MGPRASVTPLTGIHWIIKFLFVTKRYEKIRVFYLPTDAQEKCFKKNIKIYIETDLFKS
jgi:hypothetical protein